MIFAHIPAGYLLAHVFVKRRSWSPLLLWVGMLGGTLPDADILYVQFMNRSFLGHHAFFAHFPIFWALCAAICLVLVFLARRNDLLPALAVLFSTIFLHLILDTAVGTMYWLAPFSYTAFSIPSSPNRFDWWLLNDVFRWQFVPEIAIILAAALLFFRGGYRDLFPRIR